MTQFCCTDINATTLAVDTMFNLCDLWITDTTYRNKRLMNVETKISCIFATNYALFYKRRRCIFKICPINFTRKQRDQKIKADWG